MLNCLEALEKLYDYVDGELPAVDRAAVQEHLKACRPCLTHFEFETLFGEFVRHQMPRPSVREAFRERLFARLRAEGAPGVGDRPAWLWRFAIAASLMFLLTVGGMRFARFGEAGVDWPRLAAYHLDTEESPDADGIKTADLGEARAFLASRMGEQMGRLVPLTPPAGLVPHEACVVSWNTGRIAQLELEGSSGDVSLFLGTVRCFPMTVEPKVTMGGHGYRVATLNGMHAVCWEEDGGLMCVMVAKAGFPEMMAWAESVRGRRPRF